MFPQHLQLVLSAVKAYKGGIDGVIDPNTQTAIAKVEANRNSAYTFSPAGSNQKRRIVAAIQAGLNALGFDAGEVDGWDGVNTQEALNAFLFKTVNGNDEKIDRAPLPTPVGAAGIPLQKDVGRVYGDPET